MVHIIAVIFTVIVRALAVPVVIVVVTAADTAAGRFDEDVRTGLYINCKQDEWGSVGGQFSTLYS